jgi:hypothetical protein
MAPSSAKQYTLEYNGSLFAVETESKGLRTVARLFVDGQQVDEQSSKDHRVLLTGSGLTVVVRLNILDNVSEILAVPAGTDPRLAEEIGMAFAPPPGSHAARMEALKRRHPVLYAARHVALAIAQTIGGFVGVAALLWVIVSGLMPNISVPLPDLPPIPWPAIEVPQLPWPPIPWPVVVLPEAVIALLRQFGQFASSVKWLVPIVIAVFVAINEVKKRQKRTQAETERAAQAGRG